MLIVEVSSVATVSFPAFTNTTTTTTTTLTLQPTSLIIMRRPGPLQELPPEIFLSTTPHNRDLFKSRPNKRSLSPGFSAALSSTKRRALNEEGLLFPMRTPKAAASRRMASRGPGSPVKELAFDLPNPFTEHNPSNSSSSSSTTSHFAKLANAQPPSFSANPALSSEFKLKSHPYEPFFFSQEENHCYNLHAPHINPVPTIISREMPPPSPDPQSIHYPGFQVHQDMPIAMSSSSTADEPGSDEEIDEEKENVAPRRKLRQLTTVPFSADMKGVTFAPDLKKRGMGKSETVKSTPITPWKEATMCGTEQANAAALTSRKVDGDIIMSSCTPRSTGRERRERRRFLEEETDGDECASGMII